jgi:TonB family protein
LLETMPEHQPVWVRTENGDPVLPPTLPAPFLDIARNCLRADPERRLTVSEILARLEPAAPVSKPLKIFSNWRYLVPTATVVLAVAAILAGPKLLDRHRVQTVPDRNPVTIQTEPPAQKPGSGQERPRVDHPPPSSLPPGTGAKKSTGNVVQTGVRHKILPDVPQSASDTIQGTIRVLVKVAVDPSGNVLETKLDSPGPSRYFARLALEAARQWKFWPAQVDGQNVSKEWVLQFDFTRTATDAFPVQATP